MIPNYRTITISAGANENIVSKIYEKLKEEGYRSTNFVLKFVGFEASVGVQFKINGNTLKVPSSGKFISPYSGDGDYLRIHSMSFNTGFSNRDFYIIY